MITTTPDYGFIGLGWLTTPLAFSLLAEKHHVVGTTTTPEKKDSFIKNSLPTEVLNIDWNNPTLPDIPVFSSQTVIISIPFRRSLDNPFLYTQIIESISSKLAKNKKTTHVIFTSSTSVYPNLKETFSEETPFTPDSDRSKALLEAENILLKNPNFTTTICRLAGLYGYDRQPGRFIHRKKSLNDSQHPVNLIHRDDVLEIFRKLFEKSPQDTVYNCCSDKHPNKEQFYNNWAQKHGFKLPNWDQNTKEGGKTISNTKLKTQLAYIFKYPNPLDLNQP